jgi:hypothetical protein
MYYDDHAPPHFHALCAEHEVTLIIESLETLSGSLPRRALALVLEWAVLHRLELFANWDRAREGRTLESILPLD